MIQNLYTQAAIRRYTFPAEGRMRESLSAAIAELKAKGFKVEVDPSELGADVYIITMPDGQQFEFLASGLLKLERDGRLDTGGITEIGRKSVA